MYVAEKISNSEASSSNSDNIKMKKKVEPYCEWETIIDFKLDFYLNYYMNIAEAY